MKLSVKMMLVFSVMMFAALFILSSYASHIAINGANAYTAMRFRNMSTSIVRDIEQDFSMMQLTLEELTGNLSFMTALNQAVRDDTDDQKVGNAASKIALSHLYQSPLVDNYFRVSFYTREGLFITSRVDRGNMLVSGSPQAISVINELPWLDRADTASSYLIIAPHEDYFSLRQETLVYGIVQRLSYQGKQLGYIEISKEYSELERIMGFIDDPAVIVQAVFDDGSVFFSSTDQPLTWPKDLPTLDLTTVDASAGSSPVHALHTEINSLNLHLYIAQDSQISQFENDWLRSDMFRWALYIMLPTMILIALLSMSLTKSIRRLTKKVRHMPTSSMLHSSNVSIQKLTETVTSARDRETHELEHVFNTMMVQLWNSTINEMTLREGALQAHLNALQTQINPHFIYNTLNIISAKSMENGNYAVIEICDQFAQMLRYSTDTQSQTATMSEELENVRNYLMLAKARYEDNLEFTIDVPADLDNVSVPKLTLQPIVENALNHGFNGKNVQRKLSITGRIEEKQLILDIRDNGTGFSEEMLVNLRTGIQDIEKGKIPLEKTGGHIGLINTCLRLHYYSHGTMHISLRNENGAVVTLTMPCN